jgi:NitT/TauT family transport system substrate-binding protein
MIDRLVQFGYIKKVSMIFGKPKKKERIMLNKKILSLILTFLLVSSIVLSVGVTANAQKEEEVYKIRIGAFQHSSNAQWAAVWLDLYKKYGLDATIIPMSSGPALIEALAAGKIDVTGSGVPAICNAIVRGVDITYIGEYKLGRYPPFVVKKDSPYKTMKDLKGKKIGVHSMGSTQKFLATIALEKVGLTKDDVTWVLIPYTEQPGALKRGNVDGIAGFNPSVSIPPFEGWGRILWFANEVYPMRKGKVLTGAFVVSTNFLKDNFEAVVRFLAANQEANEFVTEKPKEAAKLYAKHLKLDEKLLEFIYTTTEGYTKDTTPDPLQKGVLQYISDLKRLGYMKKDLEVELPLVLHTDARPSAVAYTMRTMTKKK